jgi:hypothetical protein
MPDFERPNSEIAIRELRSRPLISLAVSTLLTDVRAWVGKSDYPSVGSSVSSIARMNAAQETVRRKIAKGTSVEFVSGVCAKPTGNRIVKR